MFKIVLHVIWGVTACISIKYVICVSATPADQSNSTSSNSSNNEVQKNQFAFVQLPQPSYTNKMQTDQHSHTRDMQMMFETLTFESTSQRHLFETPPYQVNPNYNNSTNEAKEIVMCKRHKSYIDAVQEITAEVWCELQQYESLNVIRDMNLFISRYSNYVEFNSKCDSCLEPLTSKKFRCLTCLDLDLCESCYINVKKPDGHLNTHKMIRLR